MKKIMAAILAAGMTLSMTGCGLSQETPVTEETLPLPLWAQDEEDRMPGAEDNQTVPMLTEAPQVTETTESVEETVSQRPEKYPTEEPETTQPEDSAETESKESDGKETTEAAEMEIAVSDYEMEEKFKAVKPEKVYAIKSVRIRSQGNVNSDDLGRLGEGKSVIRIGVSDDGWSAVIIKDQVRYISSDYLSTDEHPEPPENPNVPNEIEVDDMVYTIDDVNMREGPGFDRAVLCRVPEFVELHRTGIVTSGWCRVTYKDKEGFINTGYLAEKHPGQSEDALVEEEEVDDFVYTTREVNFRKGPGTKKAIIGRIPQGTKVQRAAIAENGWCKVIYEGETGYISGDYVSKDPPAEG